MSIIRSENAQPIELKNAPENFVALLEALRSGHIQYEDGVFSGKFNVAISNSIRSFGGRFDPRSNVYRCEPERVPGSVKAEAGAYKTKARAAHEAIKRKLDEVVERLDDRLGEVGLDPWDAMKGIEVGFRPAAKALEIKPELDEDRKRQLARDYTDNMKLWIRKFSEESIRDLRGAVEDNAIQGYRFDRLMDVIQQRYGVSARKAKFLARQETGLFMAKYRRQRFEQAGVKHYRWSTAHDERVREDHKKLDGRTFRYDSPPITDGATGARNNPGCDFNCRCQDIPLLDKVLEHV